jgi:hypothetical protein
MALGLGPKVGGHRLRGYPATGKYQTRGNGLDLPRAVVRARCAVPLVCHRKQGWPSGGQTGDRPDPRCPRLRLRVPMQVTLVRAQSECVPFYTARSYLIKNAEWY